MLVWHNNAQYEKCIEELKKSNREREVEINDYKAKLESLIKKEVYSVTLIWYTFNDHVKTCYIEMYSNTHKQCDDQACVLPIYSFVAYSQY